MVLIFEPIIIDVKITSKIGTMDTENKNLRRLSLQFNTGFFESKIRNTETKNGIKIPICLSIKIIGCLMWSRKDAVSPVRFKPYSIVIKSFWVNQYKCGLIRIKNINPGTRY